ncbi:hypothetical protein Bca4012_011926 [Brassica carinata]
MSRFPRGFVENSSMEEPKISTRPSICFRPINPSDLERLEQIHRDIFPIRYESEFFQNVVNGGDILSWAAVDRSRPDGLSDELIGFVTAKMGLAKETEGEETLVYILTLGVVESYRKRGIAKLLIKEVIKYASSIPVCRGVYLHVIAHNSPAIRLYKRMSFRCVRRLHGFYIINGQHFDAFLFVYFINGSRSPCSPFDLVVLVLNYMRSGIKSVASKITMKHEEKGLKWLKCKDMTRCLLPTQTKRNLASERVASGYDYVLIEVSDNRSRCLRMEVEKSKSRHESREERSPGRESRDGRRKEKDHRSKDKEKDYDREKKDHRRDKEKERDRKRDKEGETEKEKSRDWDRDRERDRVKDKEREKERDKHRDREKEKLKEKSKEKEKEAYKDKDRARVKDRSSKKSHEDEDETEKPAEIKDHYDNRGSNEGGDNADGAPSGKERSASEIEDRIKQMREERKKKAEEASDALSWVARSRKIEEKRNAEKQRAQQLSRIFEEQDNLIQGENEDGEDGEIDMLENVEIGEQKRRNEAYEAAKKKKGIYDDKFNEDPGAEKKMLPQYDEPATDEGIFLDAKGRFSGEAEKKLEELRKRIQGQTTSTFEDLNSSAKVSSDYFSHEEMLRFKKPKKKKSLRKKDKLDISALEAEAIASGLGAEDLGSRKDGKRQALKEEKERSENEKRSNAYQTAIAKADEASRQLRMEQVQSSKREEDESSMLADDAEDLYKSLERARKLALTKKEEVRSGPEALAQLLASRTNETTDENGASGAETQENTVVFTEMNDFVWGLERGEGAGKPESEDVFMDEDEAPKAPEEVKEEQPDGWAEVKDTDMDEGELPSDAKEITPDETIHEVAVGKGLSGVLKLLKDRGALKEKVEWGGRNMDKKKSKLVGIVDDEGEAFRLLSHKFHGKGPGKMKEEKRMKQYQEELKLKQMKNSDTPSLSVQRMREAQAQLKTPYIVLSGNVKPGQTSDPQSGFATVEKDVPGSLTPMLGDRRVEHFLGIKRPSEPGNSNSPAKRPKH